MLDYCGEECEIVDRTQKLNEKSNKLDTCDRCKTTFLFFKNDCTMIIRWK